MPSRGPPWRLAPLAALILILCATLVAGSEGSDATENASPLPSASPSAGPTADLGALDPLTGLPSVHVGRVADVPGVEFVKAMDSANRSDTLVVMFYSERCYFSYETWPVFEALAMSFPYIRFYSVHASKSPATSNRFSVHGLPTILAVRAGERSRFWGDRTLPALVDFVRNVSGHDPLDGVPVAAPRGPFERGPPGPLGLEDPILALAWVVVLGWAVYLGVPALGRALERRRQGPAPVPAPPEALAEPAPAPAPAGEGDRGAGALEGAPAAGEDGGAGPGPEPELQPEPGPSYGFWGHQKVE
eukprot:tig00021037_g17486.t1